MSTDRRVIRTEIGSIVGFAIRMVTDAFEPARLDVEIALSDAHDPSVPTRSLRFIDARDVRCGDGDPLRLQVGVVLDIIDVSADEWSGVRYRVANMEQDFPLSLYCGSFESVVPDPSISG